MRHALVGKAQMPESKPTSMLPDGQAGEGHFRMEAEKLRKRARFELKAKANKLKAKAGELEKLEGHLESLSLMQVVELGTERLKPPMNYSDKVSMREIIHGWWYRLR